MVVHDLLQSVTNTGHPPQQSTSNGGNGQYDGNATAATATAMEGATAKVTAMVAMVGAMATAMEGATAMDGTTVTRWQ